MKKTVCNSTVFLVEKIFLKNFKKTIAILKSICYNVHRKREKSLFSNQSAQSTWILYRK